ncbi:hypothetical protein [Methanothermococcus okinawensis]|uniref:Uncharacterized protein n=1 Tax=Methanothermococcus okinawensis (strain DSM 14208 / JCM 11175 / IH1) TaxID=647113 RepID=F8AKW7_METOI|nr:hypothetical protein [Methanothermococcus okinawensis]AEH06135.1 hypothetical protein Metok_0139 [Methanothermococcus okinawensis IH1]
MKRIYSKVGNLSDFKQAVSFLQDFTGFIKIDNAMLFYSNSKLILSILDGKKSNLKTILKNLPDLFLIEIYKCSNEEVKRIIDDELNNNKLTSPIFKSRENICNSISSYVKPDINTENGILVNQYNNIYNYIGMGLYEVILIPKKYKSDKGTLIFKNCDEIFALYESKNKKLEGKKALGKIKTIFAVSEVTAFINKISLNKFNNYVETHPRAPLKTSLSFDELIKKIKEKGFKTVKNDSLINILTEEPSLIEIDKNMYIVSNEKKPIYAFFEDYTGDKAYRYIKNFCIFNNFEIKIYPLDNEEFKLFREFRENKIKG